VSLTEDPEFEIPVAYGILQASGARITRTEFISCPSCSRTLFNIQDAVETVKARTGHLKGLKIAIMGCIVNGPGEMADAHYGYVGAGKGKVMLYKGQEVMLKNVSESDAIDELIHLIRKNGDWVDPDHHP
ncbi:MAG: flavodoxin-dependent (E)-4-hydroxy-3-methylbut-2-enyl-diphosphate synthase, partial [Bacteroidota bacterium]